MIENREAEQAFLGSLLIEGALIKTARVEPEHLDGPHHRKIYQAIKAVDEQGVYVDLQSVTGELARSGEINDVGGVSYLAELAGAIPTTANFAHHENLIFEAYRNRESRRLALAYAENPTDEARAEMVKKLEKLQGIGLNQQERSTYDYLAEIAEEMVTPPDETKNGYPTGYSDLDRMTGGLQRGDLIIIAARPSVGKTAFALNVARGHCDKGGVSHIFSLEMATKQLLQRMLSAEGNIDGQKWRSMAFDTTDYEKAMNAIGEMSDWGLKIHENSNTLGEIKAEIRRAVQEEPEERHLFIIDYLQLIVSTGKYERRDLEVGAMTRELKLLAKELEVPIVVLSQLSRGVEQRQDKRPMMSDLRESGNIEQDADVIGFLYRDDYYNAETDKQNIIEIILAKQRNGPVGTVELAFIKEYGKFCDLDYRYSDNEVPSV